MTLFQGSAGGNGAADAVRPAPVRKRGRGVHALAVLLVAACVLAAPDSGASEEALTAPAAPGLRAPGLQFFRLTPAAADTVYRLLVVPVRFPGDADLGRSREELAARLTGGEPTDLAGYWSAATGGRMEVRVDLAPTVVADHPRAWYTEEGSDNTGYGLDPRAYPHNGAGLVAEVTAELAGRVDFRAYDNTGDGIADGLLILHSGPPAPEILEGSLPRSTLLAHSFTLPAPAARGDGLVFPYALASARDPAGPWAHEMGHLLGFVDLYTANALCPGPGLGGWSLMATGGNTAEGEPPSGLDAFTRQLLGLPVRTPGTGAVLLEPGTVVRAFRAGEAAGPEYFLVERRTGADGLSLPTPAMVVYHVDEGAVDNRNCTRPLVSVRAVLCPGTASCTDRLDDATDPGLTDGEGRPTGLVLEVMGSALTVGHQGNGPVRLESVRLLAPETDGTGAAVQPLEVTVRNLDPALPVTASISLTGIPANATGIDGSQPVVLVVPAGGAAADTSLAVRAPAGTTLPAAVDSFTVSVASPGGTAETGLRLAVGRFGLPDTLSAYTAVNLALDPPRVNPWHWDGTDWVAGDIRPLADGEVVSPFFAVPPDGRLGIDHAWSLDALAPDAAQDGAQIRVLPQIGPEVRVSPAGGWGWTPERGNGNPLGGQDVLAGAGDRMHVLDLAAFAGRTVRLAFRAAGDVERTAGSWRIRGARVYAAPEARYTLGEFTPGSGVITVAPAGAVPEGTTLALYGGRLAVTPVALLAQGPPLEGVKVEDPALRRFDLVWRLPDGRAGSAALTVPARTPAAPPRLAPNPLHRGGPQTWSAAVTEDAFGTWTFLLVDVSGRRVAERNARFTVPGNRSLVWDGRDDGGRRPAAGVYFLRVRGPRGPAATYRVVLLP